MKGLKKCPNMCQSLGESHKLNHGNSNEDFHGGGGQVHGRGHKHGQGHGLRMWFEQFYSGVITIAFVAGALYMSYPFNIWDVGRPYRRDYCTPARYVAL
ncbi:unnamed protein product [Angiostrongylus costaricensis]|uniref:Proton-translocating NAD(P)(+) transhydrogenase n=1 Tax=Angiostrongylus costaricensis TaxID=334426 RepID=A0A0R3PHP1_ANGCS|nr:unnamed protein product [Angiostrongylus costaricensis]